MDQRYTIQMEYTGDPSGKPQHVVRFCCDWVGSAPTLEQAKFIETTHMAKRGLDLLACFDGGDVHVLWLKRGKTHRVGYGAETFETTDSLEAGKTFGIYVRHSLECAGKFD